MHALRALFGFNRALRCPWWCLWRCACPWNNPAGLAAWCCCV